MIEIERDVLTTKLERSSQDIVLEVQQVQLEAVQDISGISAEVAGPPGRDGKRLYWNSWRDTTYTEASPLVIDGGPVQLSIDALGRLERESTPQISSWWNPATNTLTPHVSWSSFYFRVSGLARSLVAERELRLELDIGGDQGVIWGERRELSRAAGTQERKNFGELLFGLDTFVGNAGTFYFYSDGPVELFDLSLLVQTFVLPEADI